MQNDILTDISDCFSNTKFLTGLGFTCTAGAVVWSAIAMHRADKKIFEQDLKGFDAVKGTWYEFIGPAVLMGGSMLSHGSAEAINTNEIGKWAALYFLTNKQLTEERKARTEAAKELLGDSKAKKLEQVEMEKLASVIPGDTQIWETGDGDVLFYDCFLQRYFHSSVEQITTHLQNLDRKLNNEMWVDIDDYCHEMNLPLLPSRIGHEVGFSANGYMDFPIKNRKAIPVEWVVINGQKVQCGFLQFEDPPVNILNHN